MNVAHSLAPEEGALLELVEHLCHKHPMAEPSG